MSCTAPSCKDKSSSSTQDYETRLSPYITDTLPEGMTRADVNFDNKVHLVGYIVSPRSAVYQPGASVMIILVWRTDKQIEDGWQLFTHLVSSTGELLLNIDEQGPLRKLKGVEGQPLPPSRWKPGKFYIDQLSFIVPGEPSSKITVAAGIAKGDIRLPIVGPGGDSDNRTNIIQLRTGLKDGLSHLKELNVHKLPADTTITIDGRLDEAAWASADVAGPFVDLTSGRRNPRLPTQGSTRLLWDDGFLYVGFDVRDKKVIGGFPADAKDPHLWTKDTIEIMIDPDGDGDNKDYYEIQINPQNLVFDSQFDDYNMPRGGPNGPFGHEEWSAQLTSTVQVQGTIDNEFDDDEGYTVEAKIPWTSLTKAKQAPPAPGDSWRMNFYAMQNNGGTGWSPLYGEGNFHRARRFGRVTFLASGQQKVAPPPSASASATASVAAPTSSGVKP